MSKHFIDQFGEFSLDNNEIDLWLSARDTMRGVYYSCGGYVGRFDGLCNKCALAEDEWRKIAESLKYHDWETDK